jgi:uncharacterized protein
MLIYCDSVILIYYYEGDPALKARAVRRITDLLTVGDRIAVSQLSRLECRLKPLRTGNATSLALYDDFFADPSVQIVPIDQAVFDRATLIRASLNFKLADSLHLAAAVEAGCDLFLTNDTRLGRFSDIPVEILP